MIQKRLRILVLTMCWLFPASSFGAFVPIVVAAKVKAKKKGKKKPKRGAKTPPAPEPVTTAPASQPTPEPASSAPTAPAELEEDSGQEEEEEEEEGSEAGIGKTYEEPTDETTRAPKLDPFLFGARVRGAPAFGSVMQLGVTAGVALGVRLPWISQALSIALVPSFGLLYGFRVGALPDAMSAGLLVPLEIAGRIPLGSGHVRVSGGPTLFVGRTFGHVLEENVFSIGAEVSAGYLFRAGSVLRVGPEIGYRLLPVNIDGVTRYTHLIEVGLLIELDRVKR